MNEPFPRLGEEFPRFGEQEPPKPTPRWGLGEMFVCIVLVLVALFIITTAIVGPFLAVYGEDAPETLTANSIANIVWNASMMAAVFFFVRRTGSNSRDLGLTVPAGRTALGVAGLAAATFVLMYIVVVAYGIVIDTFGFDLLEPDQQVPDEFYDSDIALGVLGVAIVISAPITEEIFFRGFLFGGARRFIGTFLAALATGLIFSLAHYNLGLIIPFTVIGAVLALSYQRSGTLLVPIGAHFLFNLVSYSILVFVPDARPS